MSLVAGPLLLLLLTGCGTTLLNQPVHGNAKGWQLTVLEVSDGPDKIVVHGVTQEAASDSRFLHVRVKLVNAAGPTRKWNWPRCDLDLGDEQYLPSLVLWDAMVVAPVDDVEEIDAGDDISRRLIFTYPEQGYPTRLHCGDVTIPLALDKD